MACIRMNKDWDFYTDNVKSRGTPKLWESLARETYPGNFLDTQCRVWRLVVRKELRARGIEA